MLAYIYNNIYTKTTLVISYFINTYIKAIFYIIFNDKIIWNKQYIIVTK